MWLHKRICHGMSVAENNWSKLVPLCRPWGSNTGCQVFQQALYLLSHPSSPKAHLEKPEVTAASLGSLRTQSCSGESKNPVASPVWAGTKPVVSQPSQAELLPGTGCHFVVPEKRTLLMPRMEAHTYCPAWFSWGFVFRTNNEMSMSLEFGV